ncbi:MAG TPA: polysaccharide lyase family 7 protein [Patescibacteria group bacterium]|nr:polysaccharide lyase family 7 protein [Patescibacteria group bacterium]
MISFRRHRAALAWVAAFGVVGVVCLILVRAATLAFWIEPELGTVTSPARVIDDPSASGGKAVSFSSSPVPAANLPSQLLDLNNWKITLPIDTGHAGSPDEIQQPELANFSLTPYFRVNEAKDGVVFQANAGGATTSGSGYPRSELREMTNGGKDNASWSSDSGVHTMIVREAITHTPLVKPHVVAAQIHDAQDDVIMIRLESKRLFVEGGGKELGLLDDNYGLGTSFTVKIEASQGHIKVSYNDIQKLDYTRSGSGFYFKAGCYTQSNISKGDSASAYGEVVIYALSVAHS